jgi:hypothetical protein
MGDFLYISGMKTLFKKIFGKKEVPKEDKRVNLIAEFIKNNYNITEYYNSKESETRTYHTIDISPAVFYYDIDKALMYNRKLALDIYNYIPDDRLLQPDSNLMGKVFEKLYERKVKSTHGYNFN